jgi:hypothetical protein
MPKAAIAEVNGGDKTAEVPKQVQRVSRLVSSLHSSSRTLQSATNKDIDLLISRYSRQVVIATVDFGAKHCNPDATITMRFLLDVLLLRTAYLGSTDGIKTSACKQDAARGQRG